MSSAFKSPFGDSMDQLIEQVANGVDAAEEILLDIDVNFTGGKKKLFEFLLSEGITGKSLVYHYEANAQGVTLNFVSWTNEIRKERFGRASKVYPTIDSLENVDVLDIPHFEILESLGIRTLIAARLDWLKENHGITINEIHDEVGIPKTCLYDWGSGTAPTGSFEIVKLLRWLRKRLNDPQIDFEWLFATPTENLKKSIQKIIEQKEHQAANGELTLDGQLSLLDGER